MKSSLFLLLAFCLANFARSAEILFSDRRDEDSFKRISEHLTGKENPGRYSIIRTDPNQRNGYYIALKLSPSDQKDQFASLRIHFVRPRTLDIETTTLKVDPIKKNRALIGLTDGVWGNTDEIPNAWKIEFLDSQGNLLSDSQSFLWSSQ